MKNSTAIAVTFLASLLLAGCATTAQTGSAEHGLALPDHWSPQADTAEANTAGVYAVAADWWTAFGSTNLDALVKRARAQSHDLAAAAARVRQAQASARIAGAPLLPAISASGAASRSGAYDGDASSGHDLGLSANYELDLWAANRASRRAALAALDASGFDRDGVELALVSETVSTWLAAQASAQRLGIARSNLDAAKRILTLIEARHRAGSATPLELAQQRTLVATLDQRIASLEQDVAGNRIALAILVGEAPQGFALESEASIGALMVPGIAPDLPSSLLLRRPDLRAAEQRLIAADADIAVARAAMLPRVTLSAGTGVEAGRLSRLFDNPIYSLAAGLAAPIFQGGRLAGQRDYAIARREELVSSYRQSIITAFAEVEQALVAIASIDRQIAAQARALEQARTAATLSESRYRAGAETLLTLLDAQRSLYAAQESAITLRQARLEAAVSLIVALGGGSP